MTEFLARLKQRKLVQWTIAYVAFAFALIQVLDVVAESYDWPHSAMHIVFGLLVLAFVVTLVLAWYHGEQGRQRTSGAELLLLALVLVIGGGLLWRFGRGGAQPSVAAASARATSAPSIATAPGVPIPAKSVAVLPLANESGDKGQQYFSDGLSEDLINALSQFGALKVISRNSSFQFRDSKLSSAAIGQALGVAHLLEGSVQRLGDQVRVSAELVNAADGSTLWSQQYDRPYKDLFALQDDITKAVTDALKAKLLTTSDTVVQNDRPPGGNLAAYNDLLQGKFYMQRESGADMRKAIGYFQSAIRLDPRYALAWVGLADANAILAGNYVSGAQAVQAWDKARAAVHTALSLDRNLALAHAVNVFILISADHDWARAEVEAQRAYELAPDRGYFALAEIRATLGHARQAVELLQHGLPTDPLCVGCHDYLARYLPALGRFDEAAQAARKTLQLQPTYGFGRVQLVYIEAMRGDATAALQAAQQEPTGDWRDLAMVMALSMGSDRTVTNAALQAVIVKQAGYAAYQIAEIYALRRDPDNMFKWLQRASDNHDPGVMLLLTDPPILRYQGDPRFTSFCKKVGLPTTTDAKALP
jgi:TolB-like protein